MSDKRMKEIQYRQRTRTLHDVVTVIMLAGSLVVSVAGLL
jgi:hypothetical protein